MNASAAVLALFLAACAAPGPSAPKAPANSACRGYTPICISGDSVCSVDANGCSICTCQSRIGTETAPDQLVPGTSVPAPPMGR